MNMLCAEVKSHLSRSECPGLYTQKVLAKTQTTLCEDRLAGDPRSNSDEEEKQPAGYVLVCALIHKLAHYVRFACTPPYLCC